MANFDNLGRNALVTQGAWLLRLAGIRACISPNWGQELSVLIPLERPKARGHQ